MWKERFIDYLRYEKNYSSQTEISYLNDIIQFEKFAKLKDDNLSLIKVDSDIVRIWISSLIEQGFKASTVNRKLSSLKTFYRYLNKSGFIKKSPVEYVSGPKLNTKIPSFVSERQMDEILDDATNFSDDFVGIRNQLLIDFLYLTGMRRAELISLKDNDIDFSSCTIRVTGKGNKQRLIPFSDLTKVKLEKYIRIRNKEIENKSSFLFVKEDGSAMYPKLVYKIINNHLNSISTLSKKSPHVLRHSFATAMLNNGAEINSIKELMGHTSLSSTQIYTHVTFEEMKKTYQNAHPRANK
ncbi:MAG: tyrosine-type recombinase/integrase [Bacteroidales bacterium]|nr:tyrosine-type recombinase/integrase [Bacteroidales bacterium]